MSSYEQQAEVLSKLHAFKNRIRLISINAMQFYTKYTDTETIKQQVLHLEIIY